MLTFSLIVLGLFTAACFVLGVMQILKIESAGSTPIAFIRPWVWSFFLLGQMDLILNYSTEAIIPILIAFTSVICVALAFFHLLDRFLAVETRYHVGYKWREIFVAYLIPLSALSVVFASLVFVFGNGYVIVTGGALLFLAIYDFACSQLFEKFWWEKMKTKN